MHFCQFILLITFGVPMTIIDIRRRIIPNYLVLTFFVATIAIYLFHRDKFVGAIISAIICALFLLPITLLRHRSLGAGDTKLMIGIALLLGRGDQAILAFLVAAVIALIQVAYLSIRDRRWVRSIAFAPALIMGAILAV